MKIIKQSAVLEFITPNSLQFIEKCGRVCYKSENLITSESSKDFIKMLLNPDKKHESVLEHASATFRFITDRGVTHEIVRHRLVAYSQESTRYCNYSKDKYGNEITVILPVRFYDVIDLENSKTYSGSAKSPIDSRAFNWLQGIKYAEEKYLNALNCGDKPQEARDLLPNSLKTELIMTCNFREWRHFLKLRTSSAAHPQMRELANQVLVIMRQEVPIIFDELLR